MIRDPQGRVLTSVKARRDEVTRCLGIIGWSWVVFAQKTGHHTSMGSRYKYCRDAVPDEDILYVQRLVAAFKAVPRGKPTRGMVGAAVLERLEADVSLLVKTLVDVWVEVEDELEGPAREGGVAAVSEIAERLGIEELVKQGVSKAPRKPKPVRDTGLHVPVTEGELEEYRETKVRTY